MESLNGHDRLPERFMRKLSNDEQRRRREEENYKKLLSEELRHKLKGVLPDANNEINKSQNAEPSNPGGWRSMEKQKEGAPPTPPLTNNDVSSDDDIGGNFDDRSSQELTMRLERAEERIKFIEEEVNLKDLRIKGLEKEIEDAQSARLEAIDKADFGQEAHWKEKYEKLKDLYEGMREEKIKLKFELEQSETEVEKLKRALRQANRRSNAVQDLPTATMDNQTTKEVSLEVHNEERQQPSAAPELSGRRPSKGDTIKSTRKGEK